MWLFNNRRYFTTGVLTRAQLTDFIRISWVNLGMNSEFLKYQVYDWSNGTPILLTADFVQLDPIEVKLSDIKIVTSGYGDSLDVKLYEVRLNIINKKNTIVNIFGISDTGIISEGNTVLYRQLVPLAYRDYNSSF
ncbi:MAG: hypothetical protein H7Y18_09155 [Clostridiaceae bacterium]|nr:hypothetical protein [Clostridiaceae bacterium]